MNEFKSYHPIVNFTYFVFIIGFSCVFLNPICLALSLICGFSYSVMLKGRGGWKANLIYTLMSLLVMAVINPLFNHEGVTVLAYFPGGNPLTFESVIYGICAAGMIAEVILWFSCYNQIMTSDKFIYIFGRVMPSISLVISMTLRFVPRFTAQLKNVVNARKCMGQNISEGSVSKRLRCGLDILSTMVTWSLENAVETADSMKSRGYGLRRRTAYSIYRFDKRDKAALMVIYMLGIYIIIGGLNGSVRAEFFPSVNMADITPYGISVFAAYFILCIYPIFIEAGGVIRWNALKSRI